MFKRTLLGLAFAGLALGISISLQPRDPSPELIQLAVRATLYALPTATPVVVEVTRIVMVTQTPTPTSAETAIFITSEPTQTALPTLSDKPTAEPTFTPLPAPVMAPRNADVLVHSSDLPSSDEATSCPVSSSRSYTLVPVTGDSIDHPDYLHGDLNLGLRDYVPVNSASVLVDIPGPVDSDPPQLRATVPDSPNLQLGQTYSVNGWDWSCGDHGCGNGKPAAGEVSMIGFVTAPGTQISIPARRAQIYGSGYVSLVLYADTTRLTLVYTREDTVANGYSVHIEKLCVDPALLATYRSANQAGRRSLPAIRNGEIIGVANGYEIAVAVRDRGTFGDPRSRKDWWQ